LQLDSRLYSKIRVNFVPNLDFDVKLTSSEGLSTKEIVVILGYPATWPESFDLGPTVHTSISRRRSLEIILEIKRLVLA
jgi:hypothetical protein